MTISVFDLFTVGIGPSSSHTVGPMRAAAGFVADLDALGCCSTGSPMSVSSCTARSRPPAPGHGTLPAVLLGLEGVPPGDRSRPRRWRPGCERLRTTGKIMLGGRVPIALSEDDIALHPRTVLDFHPNGMTLTAYGADGQNAASADLLLRRRRIRRHRGRGGRRTASSADAGRHHRSRRRAELLALAAGTGMSISEVMLAPRAAHAQRRGGPREAASSARRHGRLRAARHQPHRARCPARCRCAAARGSWYERLSAEDPDRDPRFAEDWVNLVALAVNEENASGGRIVTAPTNGAAGIIPAVLHYAVHYTEAGASDADDVAVRFLLTAGAIGSLYKERASISGAEVGCQGEVGSASSMAAGGLAEILGGTPEQVENAAEIAMEHSLGLTCDPIAGLVQIPCIERNAISAGKAINAARMALRGDGTHRVSLDEVIDTMRATGRDMSSKYKETSTGGLAVNVSVNYVGC